MAARFSAVSAEPDAHELLLVVDGDFLAAVALATAHALEEQD